MCHFLFYTSQVPLGVILKNENKKSEMIDIMEELQQYVPARKIAETEDGGMEHEVVHPILFGGDQLTAARARGSSELRINSDTPKGRLEALTPVAEDWHTTMTFLVVRWSDAIIIQCAPL